MVLVSGAGAYVRPYAWRLMLRGPFNKCQARYTLASLLTRRLAVRPMYYQDVGTVVPLPTATTARMLARVSHWQNPD